MITPNYMKLAQRMKTLHITQEDMAKRLGYSLKQYFRIITGETPIRLETAYKMLEILQANPSEIMDFFPPENKEVVEE